MTGLVQRARAAQASWAATPVRTRVRSLRRLRGLFAARMDDILSTVSQEIGKPRMDALTGDLMVVLEAMRFNEQHVERVLRHRAIGKPAMLFSGTSFTEIQEPHGVALVIAPWNYPFQLSLVPALTALITGNAVLIKCSDRAPQTAALIATLFQEAGFADDLVQVSAASPSETQSLIEERPDILFFTGSTRAGTLVAQQAAALMIPAVLELGGKDPCLVFASSDLSRAVDGVCYGAFSNAGQVCVAAKRVYVERAIWNQFLPAFVYRASQLRIGAEPDADIGAIKFQFLRTLLAAQVDDAVAKGATLHTPWDGRTTDVVPPLILTGVPDDALLLVEESFGPVVCLAPFDTEAEAIAGANASQFALGASVFTGDRQQAMRVAKAMGAGSCSTNDCIRNIGNPYAAFGGNRSSGHGRYHGIEGLRTFTRTKTIMENTGSRKQQVHWFPFTRTNFRALQAIMILRHSSQSPLTKVRQAIQRFR